MDLEDKIRGMLFGLALGDALGGPLEFMKEEDIRWQFGIVEDMIGGGWLKLEPGETTDDTAMTLCVVKGIMENKEEPIDAIGKYFMEWYASEPKDIGMGTRHALEAYQVHRNWIKAGEAAHTASGGRSAGNGALMRCAPVAYFYRDDYEKMIAVTKAQSQMTHIDPLGIEACCINNHIVWELLQGKALEEGVQTALEKYDIQGRYRDCIERTVQYQQLNPSGFAVDTLRCSLYALMNTGDFYDAVVTAVNMGGDADTIGAVTGAIAGVHYGYAALPAIWVYQLKDFHEIDALCEAIMD
ncbi:ADP-ribosyl-[dinitrogen reductase] hydrolase [Geosporobacter subterraneus DSM 17957]|uniref:ADP-ribosyl-[dinitrogen reductase] hydrolase n=1 Tax=Geosporobacter subterraneus DSM 17957 TaxID=1121919 RepID=A0A1M6NV31_9FIRM|nr:ADP-ribosylglycohydrolase family protein [Geosporobacter subterraneus]SHJ99498.1 ADP-ribosyl-[dinitrogen reductase] hydrolase [Geosporobacter subterraneus DSM 17957]